MEFIKAYLSNLLQKAKLKNIVSYGAVFAVFFSIHGFIQFSTKLFADSNDSYYHAKMGLLTDHGVFQTFPWLYHTILRDGYVDHHYLFHVLLYPFIKLGIALHDMGTISMAGIYFGPKLFVVTILALVMTLAYGLLRHYKVPLPWLWLLLITAAPYDFFFRLHMIRVQGLSLAVLLLALIFMWKKWNPLLGILSFFYVWTYGGFFFLPLFVLIYAGVVLLRERKILWSPLLWAFGGMVLGFLLHPYFPKTVSFLYDQIFVTGLGYNINVGGEWKPYDTWYIFQMGAVTFLLQGAVLAWTLIRGQKLSNKTLTLLFISLMFLLLMWKSKRFVEYWPIFATLFSAFAMKETLEEYPMHRGRIMSFLLLMIAGYILYYIIGFKGELLSPVMSRFFLLLPHSTSILLSVLAGIFGVIGLFAYHLSTKESEKRWPILLREGVVAVFILCISLYSIQSLSYVVRDIQQNPAYVEDAGKIMDCVRERSAPGDIVMTDDWDIFPIFFFFNDLNYYIVGLDPVFMNKYNPDLYQNFADITMGKIGTGLYEQIRDVYKAKFVVMDRSHVAFKNNIIQDGDFQEICSNVNFTAFQLK